MYRFNRNKQMSLSDFNQPIGLKMSTENRRVKMAESIPWDEIEVKSAALFRGGTGMPAKPLQTALGSLLIQKQYGYSDREPVEQIRENPYYQFFIGLPGYEYKIPFVPSLLVEFRKRLTDEILIEINEMIASYHSDNDSDDDSDNDSDDTSDDDHGTGGSDSDSDTRGEDFEPKNQGTLILDATCAPQEISYPQDVNLLNEARENIESIIDTVCYEYNYYRSRMYRKNVRKDYLSLAKCKKRSGKKIRQAIKK